MLSRCIHDQARMCPLICDHLLQEVFDGLRFPLLVATAARHGEIVGMIGPTQRFWNHMLDGRVVGAVHRVGERSPAPATSVVLPLGQRGPQCDPLFEFGENAPTPDALHQVDEDSQVAGAAQIDRKDRNRTHHTVTQLSVSSLGKTRRTASSFSLLL